MSDFPTIEEQLIRLYKQTFSTEIDEVIPLPRSGSDRRYFRLKNAHKTVIGAYNPDEKENQAFVSFSHHFQSQNIPVPEILSENLEQNIYLLQDLGDSTLFQQLQVSKKTGKFPDDVIPYYHEALQQLARLQILGGKDLNYSLCYPKSAFDRQSILWDLNYFKYYFLNLSKTPFDEQALEADFQDFADELLKTDNDYFMFRDFQSRNIMLHDEKVWFIDYQGGRKGPRQYDIASLLWQAKANLPYPLREKLLHYYIDVAKDFAPIKPAEFIKAYYGFVLVRCLQVLGAYGFRGLYEGRKHFITSIPFALNNLKWLLNNADLPALSTLRKALEEMIDSEFARQYLEKPIFSAHPEQLTIRVFSFSYKNGYPEDHSGHGGGFAFDCRSIHNPGRYAPYKKLTGRDEPVKRFLEEKSEIKSFLKHAFSIVDKAVETYLSRDFTYLSVGFGCTGGQHRSVYSADALAEHLKEKYQVNIQLEHLVQDAKNWIN